LTDPNSASIDLRGREVILTLPTATISKCSHVFQSKVCEGQAVIKMVAVLFTQGLDIQQSIENMMGSTTRTQSVAGAQLLSSVELEHFVNSTALEKLNTYCFDVKPFTAADIELRTECAPKQFLSMSGVNVNCHPWIERVAEHVRFTGKAEKNVAMLMEVQRVCHALGGCKVTFCKSGKDRTGMVMSLEQSRILGERFNCGDSEKRVIKDAELMRLHGPRLQVCTKNIGRPLYSINKLQAQFLPVTLRPPRSTMEDMSIFGGNKDST
jgi:inositol polyphosphate-4-phosphatase